MASSSKSAENDRNKEDVVATADKGDNNENVGVLNDNLNVTSADMNSEDIDASVVNDDGVILISPRTKLRHQNLKCVNRSCKHGEELIPASQMVCTYYHMKYKKKREVCAECYKRFLNHYKDIENKFFSGKCIMDGDFQTYDSHYIIESSDDEKDDESTMNNFKKDLFHTEYVEKAVSLAFDFVVEKHDSLIKIQTDLCERYLDKKYQECLLEADAIDQIGNEIENEIASIKEILYTPFKPITSEMTNELEIITNEVEQINEHKTDDNITEVKRDDEIIIKHQVVDNEHNQIDKDIITMDDTSFCSIPKDLPKEGPLEYPPLKDAQIVYAMKYSLLDPWRKCAIKSIVNENYVHINSEPNIMTTKQIAYYKQSPVLFPVGSRVIAKFHDPKSESDCFYAGVVAEPPKIINEFRYMIFFDNGCVQYCHHKNIRLIVFKTHRVSNDVHPNSQEFIRNYLDNYPERQMVRLNNLHHVRAEYQNHWHSAKVLKVDASLVQLYFTEKNITEWLYRGSSRLWNIFQKQSSSERGIRIRQSGLAYLNKPFVEYSRVDEESLITKCVARKSTVKCSPTTPTIVQREETKRQSRYENEIFRIVSLKLPKTIAKPIKFVTHKCSHSCVEWIAYSYSKTKRINVLAIPLHFGFNRYQLHFNNTQKCVIYRTPCGRSVRTIKEMYDYLVETNSKMTIDLFDFNSWVKPLYEFQITKCIKFINDISEGKEFRGITCVNSFNTQLPPPMEYMTTRQPKPGVYINEDEGFLCGCDCTDNCQDKSKCSCWQMTIEGQNILPNVDKDPNIGYIYRRLPDRVLTGIYECNKKCKCSIDLCLNRVVQHPLSHKLQLFLTEKKGWGVRCLNDIPLGSFICIYVGSLLTECDANEGGKNYGDEYLAELDYIDVIDKVKEDYENEALPPSDSDNKTNDASNMNSDSSDEEFSSNSVHKDTNSSDMSLRLRKRQKSKSDGKTKNDFRNKNISSKSNTTTRPSMRSLFGKEEDVYVMDAKTNGNIGRYINHSCSPNMFVQNVFVDTHDLRFPWISFFALHYIEAGTELTWDYSYEIGSVPGRIKLCHCETIYCRGRLL